MRLLQGGTVCFVHTGARLLGVSAAHVHTEIVKLKAAHGAVHCQVGGHTFEPADRLLDISQDVDLVTYDFSEISTNAARANFNTAVSTVYTCLLPRYTLHLCMAITRFRHKGLARFFSDGSTVGIQSNHAARLRLILGRLAVAVEPRDMGLPGLAVHPLKGSRAGTWAVSVSGNWRVTFRFDGPDVIDVDYEDYH